jgi:hypothetical protein
MKRFLGVVAALVIGYTASAQEIGIRFGDALGNNFAIDGVFSTGEFNRIHADVNFGDSGVGIEALWDFLYRPLGGEAFNWYVGAGPSLLLGDPFILGVSGEIGLEYHFNGAPIAIGADWRPIVTIVEDTDFFADMFGFNVRYVFSKK